MVYGEGNLSGYHNSLLSGYGGMAVWVRSTGALPLYTEYTINFPQDTECDILIVGGGGAGGYNSGGGGGAGGLVYGSGIMLNGIYNIKVGKGGVFNTNNDNTDNGKDSVITKNTSTITAKGGGSGGDIDNLPSSGGSGGGGASSGNYDRVGGISTQQT